MKETVIATVTRGPESWAYIYVALGFAIMFEGEIVALWSPLTFPWNEFVFISIAIVTGLLFLNSGWFQNKLIGCKIRYENKAR